MKIENLKLVNFRNYHQMNLNFSKNLNIIYGDNGSGKSNLIEAIYLLSLTKSFRTLNDKNLIKKDKNLAIVTGIFNGSSYSIEIGNDSKKILIDNKKINKVSEYITKINIVLFNPLDTKIITDSPSVRRKMLNIEISQIDKNYIYLISAYNKYLKNRNAYLKQLYLNGNASMEYLDILTKKIIEVGIEINRIRNDYINMINENITKIYENIFEYGKLTVKYNSFYNNKSAEELEKMYKSYYRKEINYRKTILGIHHDDIEFILDNFNIKEYGSIGQQKNSIISFKLSELLIIKQLNGTYPILILDDLFSELDNNKINNIISMLNKEVQTFITTTDINMVDKKLLKDSDIYYVSNGNVERNDENGRTL